MNSLLPAKRRPALPGVAPRSASAAARRWLLAIVLLVVAAPGAWSPAQAATAAATPAQMLGPFYPVNPDAKAGSDLTTTDGTGRAQGELLRLDGKVLDTLGRPLPEVVVEIWQTNAFGRYHHPRDDSRSPLDPQFRGYGRDVTCSDGSYEFRTIMPTAYPGRTPHVHFRLSRNGRELLVTQMYLPGEAGRNNERDALFAGVRDPAARARLIGVAHPGRNGERALRFDIVIEAKIVGE